MNSKIKTFALATVVCLFTASAFATQPGNNGGGNGGCGVGQSTNGCSGQGGAGGNGGNGGAGGNGTGVGIGLGVGIGYSNSESKSSANSVSGSYASGGDAKATGGNASATGGGGGTATSTNSNSVSGYGGSASGQGSGNSTSVNFEGSTYKEAAQTAYAPVTQQPRTSCRIFVGLGGSSRDGSLSGGIPIGNDQSCLSGLQIELMDKANKVAPGTFVAADYLLAVCAVEGMDKMASCRK